MNDEYSGSRLRPTLSKMAQAQNQTQNQPSQPAPNQPLQIITKEIPRTREKLPAIGLGTFMTFDVLSNQPGDRLQQVMRRFWDEKQEDMESETFTLDFDL